MKNKKEQIYDLAKQTYLEYGSCAQAVLITLSKEINHIDESLIRASHTLSGGSGLMGFGMCGALNGGLLAISSKYGRPLDQLDKFDSKLNNRKGRQLIEWFISNMNGFSCNDFQMICHNRTFDMWDSIEKEELKTPEFKNNCAHLCGAVASKCLELI